MPAIGSEAESGILRPAQVVTLGLANTSGGGLASVAMMESAPPGPGDDVALIGWLHRPRTRGILGQGSVRTMPMDNSGSSP